MATTTNSLFGISPQLTQEQLVNQRAQAFTQMPQNQRLAMMGYQAGNRLGSALAGAFGVDVTDPMVRRATRLRQLASQFDTTTPEGLRQLAATLRQEDPDMALRVIQQADALELGGAKVRSEQALAEQRSREKASADPVQKIITSGKYTPASVAAYSKSGDIADLELLDKGDPTTLAETSEGIFLINKTSGQPIRRIGSAPERGTRVNVGLPQSPGDITKFRQNVNAVVKPFRDAVNASEQGIELVNEAIRNKNFAAYQGAIRQLAKSFGEAQISNQDVRSVGLDPSLVGSVADVLTRLTTGVPTEDTLKQIRKVLEITRKKNQNLENTEIEANKRLARRSGLYKEDEIEDAFSIRKSKTSFNSVQEAEAANLPKGTQITINGRRAVVE